MHRRIYGANEGQKLVRFLRDNGQYILSREQAHTAAKKLGIQGNYENALLASLVGGGWLQRLRRGLYAISDAQIHPFAVATRLVEPSAISYWSALNHHGLTEQVSLAIFAMTPAKIVTPSMRTRALNQKSERHAWEVGGVSYRYINVSKERFFGIEQIWVSEYFRVPMTDKERTVLETFVSPRLFGGMGEALSLIEQNANRLDIKRLVAYAVRYRKASVAKRLGWALERNGTAATLLAPLLRMPVTGVAILDPTRPRRGPSNSRWQIQENLGGHKT